MCKFAFFKIKSFPIFTFQSGSFINTSIMADFMKWAIFIEDYRTFIILKRAPFH